MSGQEGVLAYTPREATHEHVRPRFIAENPEVQELRSMFCFVQPDNSDTSTFSLDAPLRGRVCGGLVPRYQSPDNLVIFLLCFLVLLVVFSCSTRVFPCCWGPFPTPFPTLPSSNPPLLFLLLIITPQTAAEKDFSST